MTSGREQDVIMTLMPRHEDSPLPWAPAGFDFEYDRVMVWADREVGKALSAVEGVFMVEQRQSTCFVCSIDPRYDVDYVCREIEAAAKVGVPDYSAMLEHVLEPKDDLDDEDDKEDIEAQARTRLEELGAEGVDALFEGGALGEVLKAASGAGQLKNVRQRRVGNKLVTEFFIDKGEGKEE